MSLSQHDENGNPTVIEVNSIALDQLKQVVTNAVMEITYQRTSDGQYFDGTLTAGVANFAVSATLLSMTEISDVNSPGKWQFLFDTNGLSPDTYLGVITDSSGNVKNVPQFTEDTVGDGLAKQIELAASNGVGRALYDEVTSVMTLYSWRDSSTVVGSFDMKDKDGNPAGLSDFFEKVPQ